MKRFFRSALLLLSVLSTAGCNRPSDKGAGISDLQTRYWNNESVRKGLYVKNVPATGVNAVSEAVICLAGREYHATGVNCYGLFSNCLKDGGIDLTDAYASLDILKEQGVGVVRFNCGVFYSEELPAYTDHRDDYLAALRKVAAYAQQCEIGLIPSFFWNYSAVSLYYGEPYRCWGKAGSRTVGFLMRYTEDVVTALREYKSIFGWEFGNELNLQADLPNWQERFDTEDPANWTKGDDIHFAFRTFADIVRAKDPDSRMILSGNATLRPSQYHQYVENSWDTDDTGQYRAITNLFNPYPINTVTEHVYETGRKFSDCGKVSLDRQLREAMYAARTLNKAYVVGEFAGVLQSEEAYRKYYDAFLDAGVQLTLLWNFALRGDVEHSFTATEPRGQYLFGLIREYNEKYARETGK